ncbi:hypothetical protein COB52_00460 [Candidatus Kaiserbacteria bacterium]|nr:MAG: hypothetical protein COB52_00460 [Candidatus Kaiserbacteria bacterium]
MKQIIKWALSDLLFHRRFTLLFIFNLALGLTGLVTLDSFRHHLENSLELRSKLVLGADLGMSSRHPLTERHKAAASVVLGDVPSSDMIETYSMVASTKGESRLVQIKAIDAKYPFYGAIRLRNQGTQSHISTQTHDYDLHAAKNVWVYPEVLPQLGLKIGEMLKIGSELFKITDVVEDDAASGFSTSMAPRIYIDLGHIKSTGLISAQSLAWYSTVYKTKLPPKELERATANIFEQKHIEEDIRIYSHRNVSQQMSRMLTYLSDYLALVSIAAIFLACIGAAFLFRTYLNSKIKEVAIFRSLGMSDRQALSIYIVQITLLGIGASLLTFAASQALTPLLTFVLEDLVSVPIVLQLRVQGLAIASLLGIVGSWLICLPVLAQIRGLKPALLFRSESLHLHENFYSYVLHFLGVATLWATAVWQSNSWLIGSSFIAGFLITGALLGSAAYLAIWLFDRYGDKFTLVLRIALRNLARQPKSTISCFLALGMGVMLLNIIPQVEATLQAELEHPEKSNLPSLFLFDIQEDQVEVLQKVATANQASLGEISPMIRSRLVAVNGKAFEKTNANQKKFSREDQQASRFRNRGYNLSYRAKMSSAEKITEGRAFSGRFNPAKQAVAELSVEKRFAGRLGLKLGDLLTFEIQSIPIEAKVVNLRSVRWTSFQPNFFLQLQPGVLDDAPKTFVTTVGDMNSAAKIELQNKIVKALPNLSIIDVSRMVARISNISSQMSVALQFMALLCILVGFLVMYSIASHQAVQRRRDINLVKVLGAPATMIRNFFVLEFSTLALLAGLMGVLLSVGVSYAISKLVFDAFWSWNPVVPIISLLSLILLATGLSYLSVRKVLHTRAAFFLK